MNGLYLSRRMNLGLPFRCRRRLTRCRQRSKSGRHTRVFTAVNPLCKSDVDHSYESGQPRVPNRMERRRHHDAVYWFDLKIAQDSRVVVWRTMSHAIILEASMPAECLAKVVPRDLAQEAVKATLRPQRFIAHFS